MKKITLFIVVFISLFIIGNAYAHNAPSESYTDANGNLRWLRDLNVNLSATTAPTTTDDVSEGYRVGSLWIDINNDAVFTCVDNTEGAAVWSSGGGTEVDTDCSTYTTEGQMCWDSDDDALYVGNGTTVTLISSGSGDMIKAVYDTNDDGTVGSADSATTATTASALAADPANCSNATYFAVGVNNTGVAECEAIGSADIPNDTIKDTHVDWGIGATQVSGADIPIEDAHGHYLATDVEEALDEVGGARRLYNGTFLENFDAIFIQNGANVDLTLEKFGTGDLTMFFSDGEATLDCTPICSVQVVEGTNAAPQQNFIYILQSTKALAVSTTDWPEVEHIKIAYALVPSDSYVASDGVYINQNWNDHLYDITNEMGHLTHITQRIRHEGALYHSGVDGAGDGGTYVVRTAGTPDTVFLATGAGVIMQMHKHTYTAKATVGPDDFHVVNSSVVDYEEGHDLYNFLVDADGDALTGTPNSYYNLVLWGVANKTGEYEPLMINLPTCSYATEADATGDVLACDIYTMPREFNIESGTGFLIARLTMKWTNTGSDLELASTVDLRGTTPYSVTGGGGSSHSPVTLAGTPDYLTISGQVITMTVLNDDDLNDAHTNTTVTVTDDEITNTEFEIPFTSAPGTTNGLKSDSGFTYNPSTGKATATGFIGALTGQADTVATITGLAPDTATTQATQASITTAANLVTVGALNSGSIATGFGVIDNGASDISTTGILSGKIGVINKGTDYTIGTDNAEEAYGFLIKMTATGTATLPAVAIGMSGCVYSTTAAAIHVDANANDRIILNGTALDDGDKVSSASGVGDYICYVGESADGWLTMGRSGTWTDGGI